MERKHILIVGNPVDGFDYYGPFDYHEDALKFAEGFTDAQWWVVQLLKD